MSGLAEVGFYNPVTMLLYVQYSFYNEKPVYLRRIT